MKFEVIVLMVLLGGCSRVPDCEGRKAEVVMTDTIYAAVKWQFIMPNSFLDEEPPAMADISGAPQKLVLSPREELLIDMYRPLKAIESDKNWLLHTIPATVPKEFKEYRIGTYLKLDNRAPLRNAVRVRISDYEHLPDRMEDGTVYKKVCRANIWIESLGHAKGSTTPVNVTYSINPIPRSSRRKPANPFYYPVNFFEASEPPLDFELTEAEKTMLMALGVAKKDHVTLSKRNEEGPFGAWNTPAPSIFGGSEISTSETDSEITLEAEEQSAETILTRRALRAFRHYYEHAAKPSNHPYPWRKY